MPTSHACLTLKELPIHPADSAPRNVIPHAYFYDGFLFGELAVVQAQSGEVIDVTLENPGGQLWLLVPDRLLEAGARYEVVSDNGLDEINSGFTVTDEVDETPPPRLRITSATHLYQEDEPCIARFTGGAINYEPVEDGAYVEIQAAVTRSDLYESPIQYRQHAVRPAGFERGDTFHVRARWRDVAGNAGEWSEIERVDTPSDCGCATPSKPARGPWVGMAGLVGVLGLLTLRRRLAS